MPFGQALQAFAQSQVRDGRPRRRSATRQSRVTLFGTASDADRPGAGHLGELSDKRADRPACRRDDNRLDAEGNFDRNVDWWKGSGKHRLVEPQLPFDNGRSDLLTGSGSGLDIQNINLLAIFSSMLSTGY